MALPVEIGTRLSTQGVTDSTWDLQYIELQPQPDRAVAVIPSGGFSGLGWSTARKTALDQPTFQVVVRGQTTGIDTAYTKIEAVRTALDGFDGTLGSYRYTDIRQQGDILSLGRDENDRPLYALNFVALRSRTT